jgi:hypothetical protein
LNRLLRCKLCGNDTVSVRIINRVLNHVGMVKASDKTLMARIGKNIELLDYCVNGELAELAALGINS